MSVGKIYDSGSTSVWSISIAKYAGVFMTWSPILISDILFDLLQCRELNSFIRFHVFLESDLLISKLSVKYLRMAFLISLLV